MTRPKAPLDEAIHEALAPGTIGAVDSWQFKVFLAIADEDSSGLTDHELNASLKATSGLNNLRARRIGLTNAGLIQLSGEKRSTGTGKAGVYVLSEESKRNFSPNLGVSDIELLSSESQDEAESLLARRTRARARLAMLARQMQRGAAANSIAVENRLDEKDIAASCYLAGTNPSRGQVEVKIDSDGVYISLRFTADEDAQYRTYRQKLKEHSEALAAAMENGTDPENRFGRVFRELGSEDIQDFSEWLVLVSEEPTSSGVYTLHYPPNLLEKIQIAENLNNISRAVFTILRQTEEESTDPILVIIRECLLDESIAKQLVRLTSSATQVLLSGPPGTGKTHIVRQIAKILTQESNILFLQFHPNYSYEDFVEGIRPKLTLSGAIGYELVHGPLRQLSERAAEEPDKGFVLVIDELNRADIPRVFGELLFLLEYRGPGNRIRLPYSGDMFYLPVNLVILATMNSSDRSISTMDAALHRRFRDFRLEPDTEVLRRWLEIRTSRELADDAAERLERLNEALADELDNDHTFGHAALMRADLSEVGFEAIWYESFEPVVRDFFMGNQEAVLRMRETFIGDINDEE